MENDNEKINKKQLEEIEEEIKKQTTISDKKKDKINKKIFNNIIIAVIIVIYFVFINLGAHNLEPLTYLKDLQVFSMLSIIFTIVLFEKAYKQEKTEITIYSIESLVFSICTLMTIYFGLKYKNKYSYIINLIAILFASYYTIKSIIIYIKMKNKAQKRTSDIHKIIK